VFEAGFNSWTFSGMLSDKERLKIDAEAIAETAKIGVSTTLIRE
jgi:hypothetical protein